MARFPICGTRMIQLPVFILYFRALGAEHASCDMLIKNLDVYIFI